MKRSRRPMSGYPKYKTHSFALFLKMAIAHLACVAGTRKGKGEGKIGRARNARSEEEEKRRFRPPTSHPASQWGVGGSKRRNSYQSSPTFLCFGSPITLFASQRDIFRTLFNVKASCKGPISDESL